MKWILYAVLCLSAFACKSQQVQEADPLPFHVAILPVDVEKVELVAMEDDEKIEVQLDVDSQRFSEAMVAALDGTAFSRATLLSVPPEGSSANDRAAHWLAEAQAAHADMILDADLKFDEDIGTEINDKFWMNLPLFLLGGPATWFVNDRSYQFHVEISAHVYDVTAATRADSTLDKDSQVARLDAVLQEASLDFLDRADGAGSYALSILVPSGFLSKDTEEVPEELEISITEQLGVQVAQAIQINSQQVKEAENLVDFHPRKVRFAEEDGVDYLVGEVVLKTDQVTDLSTISYRTNGSEPIEATMTTAQADPTDGAEPVEGTFHEVQADSEAQIRIYEFKLPVPSSGPVQLQIKQDDREGHARSFTWTREPEATN